MLIDDLVEVVEEFVIGELFEQALKAKTARIIVKEIPIPTKATKRRFPGEG